MKPTTTLAMALLCAGTAMAETVAISTPKTTLAYDATKGDRLQYLYYGTRLSDTDLKATAETAEKTEGYQAFGTNCPFEPAIAAIHANGDASLDLRVDGVNTATQADGSQLTTIKLKDTAYPFTVALNYLTYPDAEVIQTWSEITNGEGGPVTLEKFASVELPVRRGDVWLSSFYGTWGNEARLLEEPVTPGMKTVKNRDGVRNSQDAHGEVMISLDGKPQENHGRVIGAAVCYTGPYKISIDTQHDNWHRLFAGISEDMSAYKLEPGETFATPKVALSYSTEGKGGVSRNFHRWARRHALANGDKERKVLLNSWEGVYLDITEPAMDSMIKDVAAMGGELFVMDDGWFGDKYRRVKDNSSLGDWVTDRVKLPHGIQALVDKTNKAGISFGIWIEPEMANTVSELYEKHPDWVIKAPARDVATGRGSTQIVLDLGNPAVQDFVVGVVDTLMTKYPDINYIKWDANMDVKTMGSQYLTADRQSHTYIAYHRGLENALKRIRAKYPELTIQACASGGGRVNYGFLPYFDEFWTSDNTDALQRVYMQWGTSHFFPAIAMASHISASPNHQTGRRVPLKFRTDVAMSGRLGMELLPSQLSAQEREVCKKAIKEYKEIRPTVHFGDLYRLISPYEGKGVASLMYVNEAKDEAVCYWYRLENFVNGHYPTLVMAGLDPKATYRISEVNSLGRRPMQLEGKTFTGAYLMDHGVEIPENYEDASADERQFSSRVLKLTKI